MKIYPPFSNGLENIMNYSYKQKNNSWYLMGLFITFKLWGSDVLLVNRISAQFEFSWFKTIKLYAQMFNYKVLRPMNKKSELFYIKVEFKNLSSQEVSTPGYYYLWILKSSHRKCFSNSYCIHWSYVCVGVGIINLLFMLPSSWKNREKV